MVVQGLSAKAGWSDSQWRCSTVLFIRARARGPHAFLKVGGLQHQRRELRRYVAETAGYIQKRSADGRYMAGTAGV